MNDSFQLTEMGFDHDMVSKLVNKYPKMSAGDLLEKLL